MLIKVISGGQTGADIAGLMAAKACGIATGGHIPKGWQTQDGPKPEYAELYGIEEHASDKYPPRTFLNAKNADATIRIARFFDSSGEKCTLKAINQYDKPYLDIKIDSPVAEHYVSKWLIDNNIKILNVAGNSERTCPGIEKWAYAYLVKIFTRVNSLG